MHDPLATQSPADIEARAQRLFAGALAAQARILIDGYATAAEMAEARQDPNPEMRAIVAAGLAYERALTKRAGGPDVEYVPGLKRRIIGADPCSG